MLTGESFSCHAADSSARKDVISVSDEATSSPAEIPAEPITELPAVTSASEWRKRSRGTFLVNLPTGVTVKARRPDWLRLQIDGIVNGDELVGLADLAPRDQFAKALPLARAVLPYIVLEPRVVLRNGAAPSGDYVYADDLMDLDVMALWTWASGSNTQAVVVAEVE